MSIVPSSAYRPVNQVTGLARALLNDQQGAWATDAFLMPFVSAAYRKVQRTLSNRGQTTFIADEYLFIVPATTFGIDPSRQVSVTDATAPPNQLPVDLIQPVKLWERQAGSSESFTEMIDLTESDGLPSEPQGQTLIYWEWRSDGIYFLGALQDTQIRMRYMKMLVDPSSPASQILIRNAVDAVAMVVAAVVANSRGVPQAANIDQLSTDALFDLGNQAVRRSQQKGRRRRSYGHRSGSAGWGTSP